MIYFLEFWTLIFVLLQIHELNVRTLLKALKFVIFDITNVKYYEKMNYWKFKI